MSERRVPLVSVIIPATIESEQCTDRQWSSCSSADTLSLR
jgi:hypothetical protein